MTNDVPRTLAAPLRQLPLKPLQRMTTASRYPDGDGAPVDLFDARDGALAVARAVVGFADQQLGALDGPPPSPSSRTSSPPSRPLPSQQRIKAQETSLLKQAGPRVPVDVLIKESLRVLP